MGLLRTKEEWRGQGCAKACVNNLAYHMMASIGITPYVFIEDYNTDSMKLFEKLGYVKTHESHWVNCKPE